MYKYNVEELVEKLQLLPHPEGGYYKEIYRSQEEICEASLTPLNIDGKRNFCTSIFFLLTQENFSAFHRIKQDELWHFYYGDPLTVHVIDNKGHYNPIKIGGIDQGLLPTCTVTANQWFGSSVKNGFALVGCTVAPGFDFRDFELAKRSDLITQFPQHREIICKLTRD
ncbi:cupin domain-containing protein [Luteibaculum oceani]|uniref:Cupin domain-containing protein n=1 Tax=Luteibaculum oceani TaxID=1294296 RepID=A0A5C6UV73_9FLAO|nr:cupin domain-containing protein [Luteibaculum oceani]TXC76131.1 cupin domain-containing protein [Luteibaculum oceani]